MYRMIVAVVLALVPTLGAADYPATSLDNRHLKLTIHLPDAKAGYYRGSRFDWSGLVSKVEYGKHTLFQEWKSPHDPNGPDDVGGTAEEFGMTLPPLGYADAKPGGKFLKIGIGLLEKPDDKAYQFNRRYKVVEPAEWDLRSGPDEHVFTQTAAHDGYAYKYVKRLTLDEDGPGFTIRRTLKNTGTKPIHTDHYGHNFLSFDGKPVGPDYRLTLAKEPKPRAKAHDLAAGAKLNGKVVSFEKELTKGTIYTELDGLADAAASNVVVAEDVKTGFGVRIIGDTTLKELHVWAIKTALCPEPFVELNLAPGAEAKWSTRYEVFGKRE